MSPQKVRTYWLHALTPLHVGTGQGAGAIDLPIMRERVTDWPVVPGSAVKGVLADEHGAKKGISREQDANLRAAFGGLEAADNAGALVFTDARLVCLPVRSLYGTFAWVSCPLVLERMRRDLVHAGLHPGLPAYCAVGREQTNVMVDSVLHDQGKIYLEDLDLIAHAQTHDNAQQWGQNIAAWVFPNNVEWQRLFAERFAIVADDTFSFLCETATEVNARVRISDDSKTVAKGALWYEESLPAESILGGFVWCDRAKDLVTPLELLDLYCAGPYMLQLGGKATTGKGRVTCTFTRSAPVTVQSASGGSDAHT